MTVATQQTRKAGISLHLLGVICGLTAGVWLGAAEAPTKLVNAGYSPFAISLCMVAGVFTARWTFPTLLKGTSYVFADLFDKKHLIVWALLAGALWAVANTPTVFATRAVGLAAAGASLMWGTMYVPYRKAYLSGMNPLSFVTAFTVGELSTVFGLTLALDGGLHSPSFQLFHLRGMVFWLFLGGFVWVIGDLFQQFATKYVGIGRGIPLSNTN